MNTETRTATTKQIDFIHSLLDQVDSETRVKGMAALESRYTSEYAIRNDRRDLFGDAMPIELASRWIERLLKVKERSAEVADHNWDAEMQRRERDEMEAAADAKAELEQRESHKHDNRFLETFEYPDLPAGRYAVTGEDGTTDFYRVDHGKNNWEGTLFIKLQISDDEQNLRGANARTIAEKIMAAGPREASIRYGKEIGHCGVCGRTLTNNDSIEAGIGPVCADKMEW